MVKGFSIIVCCYNSASFLPETLAHLARLTPPKGFLLELILVDNCCTDDSVAFAIELWRTLHQPFDLISVTEAQPGLSFARKRGIETARYGYLLFCDDDNRIEPDYLKVAAPLLESHPEMGMLGGLGLPHYEWIPSYWPHDFYIYGSGPQAKKNGPAPTLHGAGIILRKKAFTQLTDAGFRFILSDRKGENLASGGDYELCYAVRMAGFDIWYHNDLKFSHYITRDRVTREYSRRFIRESAPAVDVLDMYNHFMYCGDRKMVLFFMKQMKYLLHHVRMAACSAFLRYRFRKDEKMVFLETFHQQYHLKRMRCIPGNVLRYGRLKRRISTLRRNLDLRASAPGVKPSFHRHALT